MIFRCKEHEPTQSSTLVNQLLQEIHPNKFLEYLGIRNICINNGLGKEQKD